MNNYTIGITTFSKRFEFVNNLVKQIRLFNNNKIIIAINGEKNGNFPEDYRKNILNLCSSFDKVYPFFYIETRGLCKLWNTILINSDSHNSMILNDDLEIYSDNIFRETESHLNSSQYQGLTKINNSFSHFIVNKPLMDRIGYFDERLLGFGEEDGDIVYRLLKLGMSISNMPVNGVNNIVSDTRHDHIESGIGKYSKFNRDYIYNQKYSPNLSSPHQGMFDSPMDQKLEDINNYPTEKFFQKNKGKL